MPAVGGITRTEKLNKLRVGSNYSALQTAYFNLTQVEQERKKHWRGLVRINHWSGLVSWFELQMSYLHFVIST